ncbi:glycosyltransferase family 39 protein [uncultured Enorma sp.]|uniref:glycosyltransferase family 39 protein n=1 Tax=uncultured Enorma sp. TaxID=1714346 RepID=UPI0025E9D167|nr:glycosyltransferase family 39 protein [uncultured Enorma sp.]
MASSKRMHWAWAGVFLLGLGMLIAGALNGNIWYDEGYSVALVRQNFAQIWQLTAIDVHPPLYYWMAHAVYLAVGESILAYRLLSVAGMVAAALLGPVVVRRMFGERAGLAFSALVLFLPFSQHMAWQIRMYSWSMFTVSVCFLAALRLMSAAHANERAPRIAWAALGASGIASAYLHYYAAVAAFLINAGLMLCFWRCDRRKLRAWAVLAVAQLVLYLPWVRMLTAQMGEVASSFWITFEFPYTIVSVLMFPFTTDMLSCDLTVQSAALVLVCLGALLGVLRYRRRVAAQGASDDADARRADQGDAPSWFAPAEWRALCFAGAVYAGLVIIMVLASLGMGRMILFYRYLVVVLGPVALAMAIALGRAWERLHRARSVRGIRALTVGIALVAVLFTGLWAGVMLRLYDATNTQSVDAVMEPVAQAEASGLQGVVVSPSPRVESVLCGQYPEETFVYLDFLRDSWWTENVWSAYGTGIDPAGSWEEALDGVEAGDTVVFVRENPTEELLARDRAELAAAGLEVASEETVSRAYDRVDWAIMVCKYHGAGGANSAGEDL